MEKLTNSQIKDYRKLCDDRTHGRILTPDALRFICEANEYDPEKIGNQMLETFARFKSQGIIL